MEDTSKVFTSTIVRTQNSRVGELYNLLNVIPAKPLCVSNDNKITCNFCPKTGKHYSPKQRSKLKVRTVQEIKNIFERDTYSYLLDDLDKQQNKLFQKIKSKTLGNEDTKTLAMKMLNSDHPISRTSWLMLKNVNPKGNKYSTQFVLWNGKHIQVNGSIGGNNKFLCNVDLSLTKYSLKNTCAPKKKDTNKRNCLLRNSLKVKFKPGPLGRKKYLDDSHQRYHVGSTELVELPKPALDIQPVYNKKLGPRIIHFLNNLRNADGTISKEWAKFSVSVLGKLNNSAPVQLSKEYVSLNLGYMYDQHRILMRRDQDTEFILSKDSNDLQNTCRAVLQEDDSVVMTEVKDVVNKILDCIKIHFEQDSMLSYDEPRINSDPKCSKITSHVKERPKKKYGELDRLDVTIIQIPDVNLSSSEKICEKSYCVLGCVCESLECRFRLKRHCGHKSCMFECKCDFSKYTNVDSIQSESNILPGLMNLNNQINLKLSREEKKFHQTVILSGQKSILLKSQKRNCKMSKKYEDFYTDMPIKTRVGPAKMLTINCNKLNCENIEPWCMVHNLYKCFCKGKFVTKTNEIPTHDSNNHIMVQQESNNGLMLKELNKNLRTSDKCDTVPETEQKEPPINENKTNKDVNCTQLQDSNVTPEFDSSECARSTSYKGRKYSDGYYYNTNYKILEMEKNDRNLRKRLMALNKKSNTEDGDSIISSDSGNSMTSEVEESALIAKHVVSEARSVEPEVHTSSKNDPTINSTTLGKYLPNKTALIPWLETNYKLYKQRMDQGSLITLNPPKRGKLTLHSWDFILNRYRDRKNVFVVTKTKPYRIFLGINANHPFFENCINIDDIRYADIAKYPISIQKLLSNANYDKENFCILCGLSSCWELIGCVTKLNDIRNQNQITKNITFPQSLEKSSLIFDPATDINGTSDLDRDDYNGLQTNSERFLNTAVICKTSETSKWFVMTIENDFTEIQFYKKGFFVKLDKIMKAINVARVSNKTVRLSSQSCDEKPNCLQFGLYAIPNTSEKCVFIGPYEINESLGIEIVKPLLYIRKSKKTRGIWITTNTVDNSKVIDNPMSFISPSQYNEMVPLDDGKNNIRASNTQQTKRKGETPKKPIKPIKVRKTDGFYLTTNNILERISPLKLETESIKTSLTKRASVNDLSPIKLFDSINSQETCSENPEPRLNPEEVPKNSEKGMFILKPEEINKKVLLNKLLIDPPIVCGIQKNTSEATDLDSVDVDVEQFIRSTTLCCPPVGEGPTISLISDDEEEKGDDAESDDRHIFIQCSNMKHVGWIRAKRNNDGLLSFQFPGLSFSAFHSDDVVFTKINKILSKKVCIPKNITLTWEAVDSVNESKEELTTEALRKGLHLLTKKGMKPNNSLSRRKGVVKTYTRKILKYSSTDSSSTEESD